LVKILIILIIRKGKKMKKFLSIVAGLAIGASAFSINIISGWNLKGTNKDINISVFNNPNIVSVWTYDTENKKWKAYIPNKNIDLSKYGIEPLTKLNKYDGFWINASNSLSLNLPDNENDEENDEDEAYLVSDLVAGKVIFKNSEGNQLNIPENAVIRITPKRYQVDGNWHGINCKILNDGSFGSSCYIKDINESAMEEALKNDKVQIVIYDDENHNFLWDGATEKSYFGEENVTLKDFKNIEINITK
jgi:hypothetical protein